MNAFNKDILRTISHSKKRFLSLVAITALGATMLTGLSMACIDLRAAADELYTQQHLFDISVQSTYGLTQDDVDELAAVEGVEVAEGGFEQDAATRVDGGRATVTVKALLDSGLNEPYVVEGELPSTPHEVAVTENYLHEAGKKIGDAITFESTPQEDPTGLSDIGEDVDDGGETSETSASDDASDDTASENDPIIPSGTYTIVGAIIDPTNITQPEGPIAFRAASSSDYTFFVSRDAVTPDATFTVAYLGVAGTEGLSAYSEAYEATVDTVQERVEDLAPQRERARTDELKAEALTTVDENEQTAESELADAEAELDDAEATLADSLQEALDGQDELDRQAAEAEAQLNAAQATIDANRVSLADGLQQLEAGRAELAEGIAAYNEALPGAEQQLNDGQAQLDAARDEFYATTIADLKAQQSELQGLVDELDEQIATMDSGMEELAAGISQLADGLAQLASAEGSQGAGSGSSQAASTPAPSASDGGTLAALRTVAEELSAAATHLTNAWDALKTVDASDTAAANAAVQNVVQAVSDTNALLQEVEPGVTAALENMIEQRQGERDTAQATCEQIDATLAALAPDDPARTELEAQREQLVQVIDQLGEALDALSSIRDGLGSITAQVTQLNDPTNAQNATALATGRVQAVAGRAEAQAGVDQIAAGIDQAIAAAEEQFAAQQATIDAGWQQLWDSYNQLMEAQALLDVNAETLAQGQIELEEGQAELNERRAEAAAQIADARRELEDGLAQIADGEAELAEGRATLEEERANAYERIADARREVAELENATWYVQDRSGLGSFSSVDSDASSIEAIARIIPVIFFVVAILVSLTTATRMVDEERELIGLYKALGYSKTRILAKYLVYTVSAALIGGIIGDIAGFVLIPYILLYIFQAMYLLPLFSLQVNAGYALLGIAAFVVGIGGSTFLSCRADLRETPATLMRPKAPRAGSRIFLEHIRPLWRRMSFLNKVTARNLFRYKKRLAMTVFGIMGCTALLICGFAIKNTVESLAPRQYEQIYRYDMLAVTMPDDYDACLDALENASEVTSIAPLGVDTVSVEFNGAKESVQLYVIPDGTPLADYVSLETLDGDELSLSDAGVIITNNAATVLGLGDGSSATLTTTALDEAEVTIEAITRNYLSNAVYMTQDLYEELLGPLELNGFFAHLKGSNDEQAAFADTLEENDDWLSVTSVAKMHEQFEKSFALINVVVYVVIALAAGLAFVVLFTLSTVNIGEREREIATIKVLGFRRREVRTYINKETFALTLMGVLVGLPAGWALSMSFTYILKMPSIYFDVVVDPWCYALAAAFSIVFALAVSSITNRMLDRIIMVEALKSPE